MEGHKREEFNEEYYLQCLDDLDVLDSLLYATSLIYKDMQVGDINELLSIYAKRKDNVLKFRLFLKYNYEKFLHLPDIWDTDYYSSLLDFLKESKNNTIGAFLYNQPIVDSADSHYKSNMIYNLFVLYLRTRVILLFNNESNAR